MSHPGADRQPRARGFTLIEVLAAVFLTSVVMAVALGFYVGLSDSTSAAALRARDGRRAVAALDRIARDLEGAYLLVKPDEVDPLDHPWIFVAEDTGLGNGADRVKFVTRNHRPRNSLDHGSDLAVVTYLLHRPEDRKGFELLRAVEPGLPSDLDREFLPAEDERFMVVADGLASFSMTFEGEITGFTSEWDSSQLEQSGELPRAATIEISYLPDDGGANPTFDEIEAFDPEEAGEVYSRTLLFPMREVDLFAMLDEAAKLAAQIADAAAVEDGKGEEGEAEENEETGPTVRDCLSDVEFDLVVNEFGEAILDLPLSDETIQATLNELGISCP